MICLSNIADKCVNEAIIAEENEDHMKRRDVSQIPSAKDAVAGHLTQIE